MQTREAICTSGWKTPQTAISTLQTATSLSTAAVPSPSVTILSPEELWRVTALYFHSFFFHLAEALVDQEFAPDGTSLNHPTMSSIQEVSKVSLESNNFIVRFKASGRWPEGGEIYGLLCSRARSFKNQVQDRTLQPVLHLRGVYRGSSKLRKTQLNTVHWQASTSARQAAPVQSEWYGSQCLRR